jgi:PAS domain S-box-containing protein
MGGTSAADGVRLGDGTPGPVRHVSVLELAPVGIFQTDADGNCLFVNRRWCELAGMSPEQARGAGWVQALHPEDRDRVRREWYEAAAAGREFLSEYRFRSPAGRVTWLQGSATAVRDGSGRVAGFVGTLTDVTARKATEEALRESERRFARFMQHLPGLAWIKDLQGRYVFVNDAAAAAFGARREAILGRTDPELFPPETAAQFRENDRRALAAGAGVQAVERLAHDDGIEHSSLVSKFPILGPDGAPALVGGMAIDITERLRAEVALGESERRFRLALASGAVTVFEQDQDLRYTWVYPQDPAFPEHNIGRTDLELVPGGGGEELTLLKRRVVETGRGARRTVRVSLLVGVRHYDLLVEPRFDADGRVVGVGGAALDVTALKRVEESLQEADRRKDEFLATLAHELRNPLAPIANSVELLRLAGGPDPEAQQARDIIDRQVRQLTRLVDDLLDVSRVSRGKITLRRRRVDLAGVVAQAVETSRPLIEAAGHELAVSLPEGPLLVEGDPARLTQAIGNLLNNAAKYTDGPGRIALDVTREGDRARVAVRDSGIGIPADMLTRIFELFAQVETGVDRAHGGLGIGLTLVRSLVELHGGTVEARSDGPGRGSTFDVRLPLAAAPAPDGRADGPAPGADGQASPGCRILVVDDNVDSAVTLARLLRRVGHEVEVAHDGPAALEAAARFRPGVMLVDLGMPGMSGLEVARLVRERPDLAGTRLLAVTGWGQPEDRLRTRQAGFDHHLVKPVDLAALQSLLDRWAGTAGPDDP